MTRLRYVLVASWLGFIAVLPMRPAQAEAPDARAAQGHLEDQLIEGEIDAEDFFARHLAPGSPMGTGRGAAYLGLEAFMVEKANGASELGALVVLELPLERFARARVQQAPRAAAPPTLGAAGEGIDAAWLAGRLGQWATVDGLGGASGADESPSPLGLAQSAGPNVGRGASVPGMTVTLEVARSCVRAALRAVGLADDNRLESAAARARSSAALPELRLRTVRTFGESGRVSLSADDPSRYVESGAATNLLEARVTFRLDRLLFADEELTVERARLDRSELRLRVAAKVLQALFEWQKAYAMLQDPSLPSEDRLTAMLREAESSAILDMMTGGWFGAYRAALASRGL